MTKRLKPVFGSPVTGENRFPRPAVEAEIVRHIEDGVGAKLFGLRRNGKSSMLLFVQEEMARRGYKVAEVDAQGMRSTARLLFDMLAAVSEQREGWGNWLYERLGKSGGMPETVLDGVKALLTGSITDKIREDVAGYWPVLSRQIVQALREKPLDIVLVVDELPFLLQNIISDNPETGPGQVDQLLAALREWRNAGLKMVVAGSIGVRGLARRYGFRADHLNDLWPVDITELTEERAREFIECAVADESPDWTDEHTDALLLEVGALYPSFLAASLVELPFRKPPAPEDFAAVFTNHIRPGLHNTFLEQFDFRYRLYRELEEEVVTEIVWPVLGAVLEEKGGCDQSSLATKLDCSGSELRDVLLMLQEDGFVRNTEDRDGNRRWWPASRLVTIWWRAKA